MFEYFIMRISSGSVSLSVLRVMKAATGPTPAGLFQILHLMGK